MTTRTHRSPADTRPASRLRTKPRLSRAERARVDAILNRPVAGFMDNPAFHEPDAVRRLFDDAPALPTPNCDWYHPGLESEFDPQHASPRANVLLSGAQEKTIFLQFNFARFCTAALHRGIHKKGYDDASAASLLFWDGEATRLRDRIVEFNLALVLAMARHVSSAKLDFCDLLSEGNIVLLRAVDKFDVGRNFKFSTYACRAILKAYSRMSISRSRRRGLFPVSFDPALEQPRIDHRFERHELNEYTTELRRALESNEADLTDLQKQVVACRFPMEDDRSSNPPTLQEVGRMIGYSKERVRQIQQQAIDKLRSHMEVKFGSTPFNLADGE